MDKILGRMARAHAHESSFVFECKACVQMYLALRVVRARRRDRTVSAYFLFALYCSAPPLSLSICRAYRARLLSSAAPALSATIARAAAAALPKDKPSSVAQTVHCVRIILYVVKSLGAALRCKN